MKSSLALVLLLGVVSFQTATAKRVVCYFESWVNYHQGNGHFVVEDIDVNQCTHVIYTFMKINEQGSVILGDAWLDDNLKALSRTTALKQRNPALKTLLSVGGWNEGSTKYSQMAANPAKRQAFIQSALALVRKYGFDGFDIDWEYPSQRGGSAADKQNFATLLREFRQASNGLLLSVAVGAGTATAEAAYDIAQVSQNVDFINLMTYDFHLSLDGKTGIIAPLYQQAGDPAAWNVDGAVKYWLSKGAQASKINLGLAFYGHSFALANAGNHGINAPTTGPGIGGPYSQAPGSLGYHEICEIVKQGGWTQVYDQQTHSQYMFKGNQWVSYETPQTIAEKTKYAESKGLGGLMVWAVDTDDFRGVSGQRNPLLAAIHNN